MFTQNRKLRIFLCHSSKDKSIVRELYRRLTAVDWAIPWLDEEDLLPGQDWDMEIEKAIETTDVVIVCISNNSVNKEGYIQREIKFVLDIALEKLEGAIFVIPLRLDNCEIPRRLRSYQYLDYFQTKKNESAYLRLIKSLELRAKDLNINNVEAKNENELSFRAKLTYIGDKRKIFLIPKQSVAFGMAKKEINPEIDVTLRVLPVRSKELDNENWHKSGKISKIHGRIRISNDLKVEIIDLSQNGIYIKNVEGSSIGEWVEVLGTQPEFGVEKNSIIRIPKGIWVALPNKVEISLGQDLLDLELCTYRDVEQRVDCVILRRLYNVPQHEYVQLVKKVVLGEVTNGNNIINTTESIEISVDKNQYKYRYLSSGAQSDTEYKAIFPGEILKIGSQELLFDKVSDSDFTDLE